MVSDVDRLEQEGVTQKIGMILDTDFPPDPRVENEARVLLKAGFEVHLFALSYQKDFVAFEEFDGIKVYRFYCSPFLYKMSALAYTFGYYHRMLSKMVSDFIDRSGVTAIHIHDIQAARAVFELDLQPQKKVVLDLHENRPEIMKYYKHVQSFKGRLLISPKRWKKFEERYAKSADGVVVVTPSAKQELIDRTGIKPNTVVVASNVVRRDYEESSTIDADLVSKFESDFVVLYLGETSKRRGIDIALNSIANLKDTISNLKLVVVGSSSYDDELKENAKLLGVEELVDFEGWQSDRLFPSYIKASNVCISPLERNIHHDTTYANKLFQYMGMGGVLLVSDCNAQADLVKETKSGLVHESGSVEDFTQKLTALYESPENRQQFAANGKQAVAEKYNWDTSGQMLVDYYKNLIGNNE